MSLLTKMKNWLKPAPQTRRTTGLRVEALDERSLPSIYYDMATFNLDINQAATMQDPGGDVSIGTRVVGGIKWLVAAQGTGLLNGDAAHSSFEMPAFMVRNIRVDGAPGTTASFRNIPTSISVAADHVRTLHVENATNSWHVDFEPGASDGHRGLVNGHISFTDTAFLQGGSGTDLFRMATSLTWERIDGGGGQDTLDFSSFGRSIELRPHIVAANHIEKIIGTSDRDNLDCEVGGVWHLTGRNSGDWEGRVFFSSVENLRQRTSHESSDRFVFSLGGVLSGEIDGGRGFDTLDYSALGSSVTVNLAAETATTAAGKTFVVGIEAVFGSTVGDQLTGNADVSTVLVGNGGIDVLIGSSRRDLLIGGVGGDDLRGGDDDDILVGGTTIYDSNPQALAALLAEWQRDIDYTQRIINLRSGSLAGGAKLSNETAFTDWHRDTMTGALGRDWFWAADWNEPFGLPVDATDRVAWSWLGRGEFLN